MNYKIVVFILILTLSSTLTFAQARKVEGVVQDAAGRPIAGASVVIRNKTSKTERTRDGTVIPSSRSGPPSARRGSA